MSKALTIALLGVFLFASLAFGERVEVSATYDDVDVTVEQSNSSRTVLRFDVGAFEQSPLDINGETYQQVSIDREGILLYKGEPQLPRLSRSIIIPDDARMQVKVIDAEYVDYENVPVAPSKGSITRDIDPESIPYAFGSVYEKDEFYPSELANIRDPFIMRDYRGLVVDVNAFQYNPETKTLRVYTSVTVEVFADGPARINAFTSDMSAKTLTPDFDLVYGRRFVNYANQSKYTSLGEAGDLLIITYDAFHDAMLPLVEWKMQKGIKTTLVDISTIGNTTTAIGDFIADFYDSTNLAFVLLVGDYAEVTSPSSSGGASDPTYMKLVGSDDYPDAFIGRFSAESISDVETQVERTIAYESSPVVGDWLHKAAGVASADGTGHNGEYDDDHMDLIRDDLLGFTYTSVDQLYAANGVTDAAVAAALNEGRSLVNYTGHGDTQEWVTSGFNNADVNALTNVDMLPFILSVACVNGEFDGPTCFAEAWLRAQHNGEPTGAVATFMSSINQDWVPPMDGQDEMADLLVAQAKVTMGGVCFNGSAKMIELDAGGDGVKNADTWHIFGDPSLLLRTDTPADLTVTHAAIMLFTDTHFDVTVAGEEGALCAIYHDGTLYGSAYTDAGGLASIPFTDQLPVGEAVTLTVTSFNGMPYITTVQVIAPSGPYVIYNGSTIDDAAGNNNGMVDFGESITLGMQLKNVGPDDALDVNATIATADGYVTITDDTEAYGTIAGDFGLSNIADAFAFDVLPSVPDGHVVTFTLTVTGTARDTWEGTFTIPVHAPEIGYVSVTVDDALGGDGNGILDPGETADIIVTVENSGSGDAFGVEATMSESDSYVTIDDDYGLFGDIAASASASNAGNVYTATADAGCPMGHAVSVDLALSTTGGYTTTLNFSLTVGDRVVFYFDDFSADLGWTGLGGDAEWQIGECIGGGTTGRLDPTEDHTSSSDNRVLGNDLTSAGLYSSGLSETFWIYSPVIDCAEMTGVEMRYWHWLGCESSTYDHAHFEVFDGENWVNLFSNSATNQETAWAEEFYDMSAIADNNPGFQMRWGLGSTDGSGEYSGWNIDDIELKGYSGSGSASMSFAPAVLVDSLQPGESGEQSIRVYNTGDGSLGVWFSTNDAWLDFAYDKVTVPAGDSVDVVVTIQTTGLLGGDHVGAMNFTSNDNSNASGSVPVQLHVYSPKMEIAETSIEQRVSPEETATYELVVTNSGPGNLLYSVGCQMDMKANGVAAVQETATPIGYRATDPDKGGQQEPFYDTQTKGSGGPDAYGYTWIDSDEAGGPVFGWIDISTLGTEITLSDDNYAPSYGSPLAIGFDFPFYDSLYSALYIGSNGFISFDSGYGRASGGPLPDDNFKSYIGVWHDDIDPPEVPGHVYYYHDAANGRFIVSYDHVRNYVSPAGTGDLSFQILLYANGQITFQYDTMDPGSDTEGLNSATIGIQNSAANDALQVLYNAAYMHDQLAINIGAASWLSAEPASGTVEPYGTRTVHVNFDAAGMELGDYTGSVVFNCNDGDTPTMSLPVTMTISAGCCSGPSVGNVDGSVDELVTMNDLTVLIDHLFISMDPLVCPAEGNTDLSADELVTMSDLTVLIDHLFISLDPLPPCS